jgi:hypothetical protein
MLSGKHENILSEDSDNYGAPAAANEAQSWLRVWLGEIEDPECMEKTCLCHAWADEYVMPENPQIFCNFDLYEELDRNISRHALGKIISSCLKETGKPTNGEYRIFPVESLCFCGNCERIDMEDINEHFTEFVWEYNDSRNHKNSGKKEAVVPSKNGFSPRNQGTKLEKIMILQELCNNPLVFPGDSVASYACETSEILLQTGSSVERMKADLPALVKAALKADPDAATLDTLQKVVSFIGDKKYPNSTIDISYVSGGAKSYKTGGATLLDPTTNHMVFIGDPISKQKADEILAGTDKIVQDFKALNQLYALPRSERPKQIHNKLDMYLSIFPATSIAFWDGSHEEKDYEFRLIKGSLMSNMAFNERIRGLSKRFGQNMKNLSPVIYSSLLKNSKLIQRNPLPKQVINNGLMEVLHEDDLVEATKILALSARVHPDQEAGIKADSVAFLYGTEDEVGISLELSEQSHADQWAYFADNLGLESPSRCLRQLGVFTDKNGVCYPFMSEPIQIRLDKKFDPAYCHRMKSLAA